MNLYRFLIALLVSIGITLQIPMHLHAATPMTHATQFFQKLYWHEQVARLSPKKQLKGWLLTSLIKHIQTKPDQAIPYAARFCWDILLKVRDREKREELIERLQLLINGYNASIHSPTQQKYVTRLTLFAKRYGVSSAQTNAVLASLRVQAQYEQLESRAQKIITPAIILAGVAGGIIIGKYAFDFIKQLFPGSTPQQKPDTVYLDIPKNLENLPHCKIEQWRANQQTNNGCGYNTTFNADGINQLVQKGQPFTPQDLQNHTQECLKNINEELKNGAFQEDDVLHLIAEHLGLHNNFYILHYDKVQKTIGLNAVEDGPAAINPLQTLIGKIKASPNGIFHFACHVQIPIFFGLSTVDHWTLLSLIKQAGQQPHMIYLDSLNAPLKNNEEATRITTLLYNKLFTE